MKTILLASLLHLPLCAVAQVLDAVAINHQVDSLIQISRALTGEQNFEEALKANATAELLALEKLGRITEAYGNSCFNHGRIMHFKGELSKAKTWYLDALDIFKDQQGQIHPTYASCINNLAILYRSSSDYNSAEELYTETNYIRKRMKGETAPPFAYCLHSMAALLMDMSKYEQAVPLFLEAITIYKIAFGKESTEYARCLNGLSFLYMEMGQYENAEPLYLETMKIQEKTLGKEHSEYALSMNNLANLYMKMGNFEHAETLYLEAQDNWEKELGKEHPYYAMCLENLASLYSKTSYLEKAEKLYEETLVLYESATGKNHPDYAFNLNNLAFLHQSQGNYEKAEPLYLQAKTIYEELLGKDHQGYAKITNNLGYFYMAKGYYMKAKLLFLEAYEIRARMLGMGHPEYLNSLQNFSELYALSGDEKKATSFFSHASVLQQSQLTRATFHLSEQELNHYQIQFQMFQAKMLSYALRSNNRNSYAGTFFNNALFHKGFLLNASSQIKRMSYSNEVSTEIFNQLTSCQRRLSTEYTKPASEQNNVAVLEEKANSLEKELARASAGLGEAMQQAKWKEVQQKLQPNEAAIEFVHFQYYGKKQTDSVFYAALVLKPGMGQPKFIPLFEEKSLDSLFSTTGERKADYVNSLYTIADRGVIAIGESQQSLYELIWQPLENEMTEVKTVYYSSSGLLHCINLSAIPISEVETLSDSYHFVELGSTRQLVVPTKMKNAANDALLFGGVQYEMDSTAIFEANVDLASETIADRGSLSFNQADSTMRGGTWNYLKWTDKEVTAIEEVLKNGGIQTSSHKGFSATEEIFKAIGKNKKSPRILHIATHGFFFPDPELDSGPQSLVGSEEPVFKMSDHPMIRAGLLLAGGNYAWKTGQPLRPGMDDGILTAYEISQMNLSNTELVVLSACETGLGDIQGNEGVYGLRRAFKIAGAKYLIMSLWQVPDKETAYFMEAFYRHLVEGEMTIPNAFTATQKELRANPFIMPYQWAGFVLVE